jgi:hypothetical protein
MSQSAKQESHKIFRQSPRFKKRSETICPQPLLGNSYEVVSIVSRAGAATYRAAEQRDAAADNSTSIYFESVNRISRSWVDVLIFKPFYLESCMWPDAISRRRPWQRLDKRSGRNHEPHT